ncbi:MAG: mRNA 3'-end-processing protein rna14, partial [Watsoniomyces obsoletus]
MTARQAYHQLSNLTTGLKRTTRPRLPPALGYEGDENFQYQLNLWQDWISWEKEDPLVLKDDEPEVYRKRILYAYKQSLMALEFWPEMWYSAAEFCFENGLESEGAQFLEQGLAANPESPLLAFKQADRLETTTQNDESKDPGAKERMKNVREPYDKVLDALYALVKK